MTSPPNVTAKVLLRSEETGAQMSVTEILVPPGAGPPLHTHDFDEAYYVLEGEFLFEVGAERVARPFRDAYGYLAGLVHAKNENKRLRAELDKDFVKLPVHEIEKHLTEKA